MAKVEDAGMSQKRHKPEEIVAKLRQVDVLVSQVRSARVVVHFPPWQTVYWWFRRFVRLLLFRTLHDLSLMIVRARCGRAEPAAAILDSQTIKNPAASVARRIPKQRAADYRRALNKPARHPRMNVGSAFRQAARQPAKLRTSRDQ
jgi:hypothetical protein